MNRDLQTLIKSKLKYLILKKVENLDYGVL